MIVSLHGVIWDVVEIHVRSMQLTTGGFSPTPSSLVRKKVSDIVRVLVAKMARRRQAFQSNPELQRFVLPEVRPTGRQLGVGSYGSVEEIETNGLVCAGKRLHEALLERDNEGVINIERKYLEECQVMSLSNIQVV